MDCDTWLWFIESVDNSGIPLVTRHDQPCRAHHSHPPLQCPHAPAAGRD